MTLCIAAHSGSDIILCFDRQVGDDFSTSETALKWWCPLGRPTLCALWAGPTDHVEDILGACVSHLGPQELTLENYKAEIRTAFKNGKDVLLERGIKKTTTQLIVAGFIQCIPKLVYVDSHEAFSLPEFAAIGTGCVIADAMLRWRRCNKYMPLEEVMYYVYGAKKLGEMSPHVGKQTSVLVASLKSHTDGYVVAYVSVKDLTELDDSFSRFGPQPFIPGERQDLRFPKHDQ